MTILKTENKEIIKDAVETTLANNTLSGVNSLTVVGKNGFSANDYILVGCFGDETAEIFKILSITGDTILHLSGASKFAHPESTPIRKIPYNQVRFYRTTTTTFSAGTPLATVDIDPQSLSTRYEDNTYGTGYGWFIYINSTSGLNSAPSNPIPYADFDSNSAFKIIEAFFSTINNEDKKKISIADAFRWLNEGYGKAINALNLVNGEYTAPASYTLSISSGTQEYSLPSDFSRLLSITDGNGEPIDYVKLENVKYEDVFGSAADTKYYIRGNYIGFTPVPTTTVSYYLFYLAKGSYLTSYYSNVDLPDNNYYCLIDFMMYRASPKLGTPLNVSAGYLKMFENSLQEMKLTSHKKNANKDSWDIDKCSNV